MNAIGVLLLGATTGLQYGLLAVGLVLVYRASRFVNFAHGQLGAIAYVLVARLSIGGVPYWPSLALGLLAAAAVGAIVERIVVSWRLFDASRLVLLVATIGAAQLLFIPTLPGSPLLPNQNKLQQHGYPVPFHLRWIVGNQVLNSSQIITLILGPAIAVGLYLFFARTAIGKSIRAASSNPEAARLAGISVKRISLFVWIVAGLLSGLTAVLQGPSTPTLNIASLGPSLLLRGLAAALLAGMTDFRLAFVAGVGLGIAEETVLYNFSFGGRADVTIVVAILVAIAVRGRTLARGARRGDDLLGVQRSRAPLSERLRDVTLARNLGRYSWVALCAVLLALPLLPGLRGNSQAQNLILLLSFAIVGLSLTLLTGWAGQASLGHFALLGVGAYAAAHAGGHHWAMPAVLVTAGIVTAAVAVVIGLPALRFRGLFLAVSTLAFALVAQNWLFLQSWVGEDRAGNASFLQTRLPLLGGVDTMRGKYYLTLLIVALVLGGLWALRRTAVGRALVAVRDNEASAAAHGLTPSSVKVIGLALSGMFAGIAGCVFAMSQPNWSAQQFDATSSLTMLSMAIIGGLGTLEGPILGAFAVFAWPLLIPNQNKLEVRLFTSGALLLLIVLFVPGGIVSLLQRAREAFLGWLERGLPERPFGPQPEAPPLVTDGVSIRFGGLQALADVSLRVGRGEIVGLIGGNGAGKTTLMNCISGHLRPNNGRIEVFGQDVTGMAPEFRPYLSLTRTFQDAFLYPGLTVLETVLVAMDRRDRSGTLGALVYAPWVRFSERRKRAAAMQVLSRVGLADRADALVGELSTGMRRLCDVATVIAGDPGLVLLDEPTAGIAQRETEAFAPLLRALRDEFGCSILIVEHDMPLLMSLCDRIYALESGQVISEGTPDEVRADPRVIASYLGTDTAAIERSGARTAGRPATKATQKKGARR